METDLQTNLAFYLTGKRLDAHLDAVDELKLRPALFNGYRDLTRLRYDFPLVLTDNRQDGASDDFIDCPCFEPLSGLIDGILDKVAKGANSERIRKHVLRLEQDIRTHVARGASGLFSALWDQAALPLGKGDKLQCGPALRPDRPCLAHQPDATRAAVWQGHQAAGAQTLGHHQGRLRQFGRREKR